MKKIILFSFVAFSALLSTFYGLKNGQAQKDSPKSASKDSVKDIVKKGFPMKEAPQLNLGDPLPANLFVELAKAINPSVVNISTSVNRGLRGARDPMLDILEQYGFTVPMPRQRQQQALGTGFIIREDGLIVTNNHVVKGADLIQVQIEDKSDKLYEAKLVGSDDRTDIALIKIKASHLPEASLGSSAGTQVGEWVAAFGNPYGNSYTMTKGIISAKDRSIGEINRFPLLQTDAPINPGNSGGPLVNTKGQVIGVNSAIDARAQGIGFAIPIDDVKAIIPNLEKEGHIRQAYLGVAIEDLSPEIAEALGLKEEVGALVSQVETGGPAARGGIKPHDVILEIAGKKIKNYYDLTNAVQSASLGSSTAIKVFRNGKSLALSVQLSERSQTVAMQKPAETSRRKELNGLAAPFNIGFDLADPSAELLRELQVTESSGKPLVVKVVPNSIADRVGMAPGDQLLSVNQKEVLNSKDAVSKFLKGTNLLRVQRGRAYIFLTIAVK